MANRDFFSSLSYLFSPENLIQLKNMVEQFNQVFNEDFWNNLTKLTQLLRGRTESRIPLELWENDRHYYLLVLLAGVKDPENIKLSFKDNRNLNIKVKYSLLKPVEDGLMVQTEVLGFTDREVKLPQPVANDYSIELQDGIPTITLNKLNYGIKQLTNDGKLFPIMEIGNHDLH